MSEETLSTRSRTIFGLVGAGVIAAGAVFVAVGTQPSHGGSTYYTATFGRAGQGLDPGKSDVKIRGIAIGTVDRLSLTDSGRVKVRIRVNEGVQVADTTVASIEPVSVFGPKDLVLDLGAHEVTGPYLKDGGVVTKTEDPEELSDTAWPAYRLTKAIDPDEVATILHTFGTGLSGQGPALRRTVDNGAKVVDATYQDRAALNALLHNINGVSGTLGPRGDTIAALTTDFNRLSQVVNERPDKVEQLLDQGGELGDKVGTTLQGHGANLGRLIDGGGNLARVLNTELHNLPVMMDGLIGFFGLLSKIIRVPGPEGTVIAQARNPLPLDICQIFIDVCSPGQGAAANGNGNGGRP
ncbi:MCE family protein [Actinomadura sp. 6K520]|uniref:MlaD family protein n=1 Tax=Actinomadura sp. 6K520 TaxID=2530364 RepID=UPI0010534A23|nr:MCE family protein [Actinomadura sp. 6K520]TDE22858.1 MCE family protein [Actinomadura sp. 6K520]